MIFATYSLGGYMNQAEDRTSLADRLMMGPDGAVYTLRAGTPQEPSSCKPGEGGGRFAYSAEVPRRDGGDVPLCFKYSTEVPHGDTGDGPICFRYSAEPPRPYTGNPPVCFRFSAEVPRRDPGQGTACFRFSAEAPSRGGGSGTACFA